jgi:hypothetical protein
VPSSRRCRCTCTLSLSFPSTLLPVSTPRAVAHGGGWGYCGGGGGHRHRRPIAVVVVPVRIGVVVVVPLPIPPRCRCCLVRSPSSLSSLLLMTTPASHRLWRRYLVIPSRFSLSSAHPQSLAAAGHRPVVCRVVPVPVPPVVYPRSTLRAVARSGWRVLDYLFQGRSDVASIRG